MRTLTAIDLFCGAGGLSVGLKKAGFKVLAGVEMNPEAAESYRLNHKDHHVYEEDIRQLSPLAVMDRFSLKPGSLDLLAGCPPCQGFSSHRTRNQTTSIGDKRNDLVFDFLRFTEVMLPKTIMMENVPSLAKDRRIKKLINRLQELGYLINDKTVQVKNAADYGVPQRRKRMILKASRYGYLDDPKISEQQITVFNAIGGLKKAGKSGDYLHDIPENRSAKILDMISLVPKDGGSRMDLPRKYWLPCHIRNPDGYRDVYGRMAWADVAPTITGGCSSPSKGRFIHPEENRAITLREAALLQTFPKNYKFSMSRGKDAVALMIGNALPPEFIRRHAIEYKKHLIKLGDK